jgi:hypothetical protein
MHCFGFTVAEAHAGLHGDLASVAFRTAPEFKKNAQWPLTK